MHAVLRDSSACFGDSDIQEKLVFLEVKNGDFVVVALEEPSNDFWVALVLARIGSSTDPSANTLFQVVNIDTGLISIINADCVKDII